jgi:anthranilate phosphoribosyltransferase
MMTGGGSMGGDEPQLTTAQITELLAAMQAQGATPEEIAYVQSLMTQTT